ncbi:MAG: ABC transporter ATP-binding protein [Verrucomicrobia bacterium]|nr:ABC transporter ATP-binding protein [Verrucomicrobiota bacterium]
MKAVTYKQLWQFAKPFIRSQKWLFVTIFILDFTTYPFDVLLWPYIFNLLVEIFTRFEGDRLAAVAALKFPLALWVAQVLYVETAARSMGFLFAKATPKLQADVRMVMFDHIQRHSPAYFNERFAGSLANKMTDMTTQIDLILQQLFWPIVPALSTCCLGVVILGFINPIFAVVLALWMILHLTVCFLSSRSVDRYQQRHAEARSGLLAKVVDSFTNNFAVNLFYRFTEEKSRIGLFQKEEREKNRAAKSYVEKIRCAFSLFHFMGVILGMCGTAIYLWVQNQISTGEVVQVFSTMWSLGILLWMVGSALPILFQSFGTVKQAYQVMLDPEDMGDKSDAKPLEIGAGSIVFDNVSFQYSDKKLFENKSVLIRGGEKVGLVGYTGSGKSTFVNLILRFFPVKSGKISVDGQDISSVLLESLRKKIALIPQDPVLFHRTLEENIAFSSPHASVEGIVKAAKLAYCHDFIKSLPEGYQTKVGERGTKLSGGEKQRIAIARAILADAPILILDEATSALDSMTEKYIQESLHALMEGRTTIVIAHRLSTLSRMDRILVFNEGKIVEEGSHLSLLERDGLYAKMWKMQVGGFLPETPAVV